nr:hypothetical protein Itr_chr12CG22650 [Ipomoea trifida]
MSLNWESDKEDIWESEALIRARVEAYNCLVDSPESVDLNIPPKRPPKDATMGRLRGRLIHPALSSTGLVPARWRAPARSQLQLSVFF